jgi:hypothetical protein
VNRSTFTGLGYVSGYLDEPYLAIRRAINTMLLVKNMKKEAKPVVNKVGAIFQEDGQFIDLGCCRGIDMLLTTSQHIMFVVSLLIQSSGTT